MAKTSPGFSCSQVPSLLHACLINSQQVCIPIAFLFSLRRKEKKKKARGLLPEYEIFYLRKSGLQVWMFSSFRLIILTGYLLRSRPLWWQKQFFCFVLFCFTPSYREGNRQEGQGSPKEETGCNCLISPWSGRKKQTTSVRFFCLYKIKRAFLW